MKTMSLESYNKVRSFESVKEKDIFDTYADFLTIAEAKEKRIIPEDLFEQFKDKCDCGSDMVIKKELTIIRCCNPACEIKAGFALAKLFSNFGCKNLGKETCKSLMSSLMREYGDISHLEVLNYSRDELPAWFVTSARYNDFILAKEKIFSERFTYSEMINLIALPAINTKVGDIFKNYDSIVMVLEYFKDEKSLMYFLAHFGIKDRWIAYNMMNNLRDIILAENLFKNQLYKRAKKDIKICVTGAVNPYNKTMNRKDFIKFANTFGESSTGERMINIKDSDAVKSVDYIVADFKSDSNKYRVGLERGVLITSTDFIDCIRKMSGYDDKIIEKETDEELKVEEENKGNDLEEYIKYDNKGRLLLSIFNREV